MYAIVGLGNPGLRYAQTRHNVGFLVVERLAAKWGFSVEKKLFGALVGDGVVAGVRVILVEPVLFMNLSGQPVASILGFYKLDAAHTVVVHDDMDLPFGRLRVRPGGGAGGHNGVRDIQRVVAGNVTRVRVGVGRPPPEWDSADYVLGNWSPAEKTTIDAVINRSVDAIEFFVQFGLERTMNQFNTSQSVE